MTKYVNNRSANVLDAVYHEAALLEAAEETSSPRQKAIAQRVKARVEMQLAEMRRNLLPKVPPPRKLQPIQASLLAMTRDALLAKLAAIKWAGGATVQYAHCDLRGLSDDDVR